MRNAGRRYALFGVGLGLVAVAVLLAAVPRASPAHDPEQKVAAPKVVKLPGQVEPAEQTQLYCRIEGFVSGVHVDIGDRVKKGQVLAELAVPEREAELKQKQALLAHAETVIQNAQLTLKESKVNLDIATVGVKEAEAGIKAAQARLDLAKVEYERFKRLQQENTLPATALDEKAAAFELARVAVQQAESKLQTAVAARAGSGVKVEAAEIGVKQAETKREAAKAEAQRTATMLTYSKIVAPYDGVITRRTVDVGALVGPPSAQGLPLFVVTRVDTVRVVVAVAQDNAVQVRIGTEAVVQVGGQMLKGKVTRTAGILDPDKRTLRVEIDLPNPDGKLLPGMQSTVTITLGED
jgi:multidrug efflux pump subunit AcrA (membrane-fusion protein)